MPYNVMTKKKKKIRNMHWRYVIANTKILL